MRSKIIVIVFSVFVHYSTRTLAQDNEVTPTEIFKSFKQTDKGNCAVVSYIKASISVLGIDSVFRSTKMDSAKNDKGKVWLSRVEAELLDGTKIVLDSFELHTAFAYSKFKLLEKKQRFVDIYHHSLISYAVIAKNKVSIDKVTGADDHAAFESSLRQLDKGSNTLTAYKYLGLPSEYVTLKEKFSSTKGYNGLIVYNWKHAAYASYGRMDLWGKTKRIRKLWYYGRIVIARPEVVVKPKVV